MKECKERIDKFMKAVREKYPSNGLAWESMYSQLQQIMIGDDRKELAMQWNAFQQEIELAKWDDSFMELVINGAKVNKASGAGFWAAPIKREGGSYVHDEARKPYINDSEFPYL